MPFLGISRCMAPSAVILLILLSGMVVGPFSRLHIVLVLSRNIPIGSHHGDDVPLFVDVADLPISSPMILRTRLSMREICWRSGGPFECEVAPEPFGLSSGSNT